MTCKLPKGLHCFTRDKRRIDGLDGRCKPCKKGLYAQWTAKQTVPERRARWRQDYYDNHEKRKASARATYRRNREKILAAQRARIERDREHQRAIWRAYYHRHEYVRVRQMSRARAVRLADPEAYNAMRRAQYAANPEPTREIVRRRDAAKREGVRLYRVTAEQIEAKIAYWGGRCWACGAPWEHLDHVKPLARGGAHMLANLRPMCARHNRAKSDLWPLDVVLEKLAA